MPNKELRVTEEIGNIREGLKDIGCDDSLKAAVTLHNAIFHDSIVCPHNAKIRCQEKTCRHCVIWQKESGYLAQAIHGGQE